MNVASFVLPAPLMIVELTSPLPLEGENVKLFPVTDHEYVVPVILLLKLIVASVPEQMV